MSKKYLYDADGDRLCECHGVKMKPYLNVRYDPNKKQSKYYYRCRIKLNEWQNLNRKKKLEKDGAVEENYRRYRNIRLQKYGITEIDYQNMFNNQNGLCAICEGPPDTRWKMLAVDHNHETNAVRGLLCMVCNTMLGRLENRLEETLKYLGLEIK